MGESAQQRHLLWSAGEQRGIESLRVWTKEDLLRKWLEDLVIQIPTASHSAATLNITLSSLECAKFQVDDISSNIPAEPAFTVAVTGDGLGASCSAAWSYRSEIVPLLHDAGTVTFAIGGNSKISGLATLILDGDAAAPLPKQIESNQCTGTLDVTDLEFGGSSILSWVLKALEGVIKDAAHHLPAMLCQYLHKAADHLNLAEESEKIRRRALAPPRHVGPLPVPPGGDIINWRENRLFAAVARVVTQALGNVTGPSSINGIMAKLTQSADGNVTLLTGTGEVPSWPIPVSSLGTCELQLPELSLAGLTNFRSLLLRNAPGTLGLEFSMALESLSVTGSCVLRCLPAPPRTSGGVLTEKFLFSVSLSDVWTQSQGDIGIHQKKLTDKLLATPTRCLPGALAAAQLQQLNVSAMPKSLVLRPTSGDSLEEGVDHLLDNALDVALSSLAPSLQTLASGFMLSEGRDFINERLAGVGHATACPPGPPVDQYAYYSASDAAGVMSAIFAVPLVLLCCQSVCKRRKAQRDLALTSPETQRQSFLIPPPPHWECLASHPAVGEGAAAGVPLLLAATACLFLCSNLNISVKVAIHFLLDGDEFSLPGVFDFSLVSSIVDMWRAGSYALAFLIGFFSGCWPYLKLGLMALCWYLRPEKLSLQKRKAMLEFLDAYGKWSLVDSYVLVMFMVSFQISVSSQSATTEAIIGDVGPLFDFAVLVHPQPGFYYFMLATILSLVVGHIVTAYNRRAEAHDQSEQHTAESPDEAKKGMCKVSKASPTSTWLIPLSLFASLVIALAGAMVNSFQFDFAGLAAVALGEEGSHRPYSLIALGAQLPAASGEPGSVGIRMIQAIFFLFSLVVIIIYHIFLTFLWLQPLYRKSQKRLLAICQVLQAWSAIDVFVVSIIASVMEISRLVDFIVGDKCEAIEQLLKDPPAALADHLPPDLLQHPSCVELSTSLKPGCWCLFASALISMIVGQVVINRMAKALSGAAGANSNRSPDGVASA
eukprot:TRINITY_DN93298_c0_g1_i1.p1 TRINITY_DN93298_c0_g1~~TRINITY_DN93298_c0_g1_i1.p1  ORF type:complete len:998 (+),score=156.45 TRINITY_DN93298_c0_g1_i1:36-3029(+)